MLISRAERLLLRWVHTVCEHFERRKQLEPQEQKVILLERRLAQKTRDLEKELLEERLVITERAAKLNVPFTLWTGKPLDEIPLRPGAFDAALCFDMLDGAPEQAAAGAIALLSSSLAPNGRLLFLERATVGMPALARTYGGLSVQFDTEGGFDVGIGTKPGVGKPGGAKRKVAAAAGCGGG